MARFSQLHLLLTYQCPFECDHCFVWGSPFQTGTMTIAQVRNLFRQAEEVDRVNYVAVEGGEPFLYYPLVLEVVREARARGWRVDVLSNAYWATSAEDARLALRPLAEAGLNALTVSDDAYHSPERADEQPGLARRTAEEMGLSTSSISILPALESLRGRSDRPGEPILGGAVRFRGRAAEKLVDGLPRRPWSELDSCPHEDLADPVRMHFDALGYAHICQGLVMGNVWQTPLEEMLDSYDPTRHPLCGPLLAGGPAELARAFEVPHGETYVDECHLCYEVRAALRRRLPGFVGPDQMFGVPGR